MPSEVRGRNRQHFSFGCDCARRALPGGSEECNQYCDADTRPWAHLRIKAPPGRVPSLIQREPEPHSGRGLAAGTWARCPARFARLRRWGLTREGLGCAPGGSNRGKLEVFARGKAVECLPVKCGRIKPVRGFIRKDGAAAASSSLMRRSTRTSRPSSLE